MLEKYISTWFPQIDELNYFYIITDNINYQCYVNILGDLYYTFDKYLTEEEAKEATCSYAVDILDNFISVISDPFDHIHKKSIDKMIEMKVKKHLELNKKLIKEPLKSLPLKRNQKIDQSYKEMLLQYLMISGNDSKLDFTKEGNTTNLLFNGKQYSSYKWNSDKATEEISKNVWMDLKASESKHILDIEQKKCPRKLIKPLSAYEPDFFFKMISKCNFQIDFEYERYLTRFICKSKVCNEIFVSEPKINRLLGREQVCEKIIDYLKINRAIF